MTAAVVLVVCSILLVASLLVVSLVNRQQTRKRLITEKIWQLRRKLTELEEITAVIEPFVESPMIPKAMNDEVIDLIHTINKLDSSITYLQSNLRTAQLLAESYAAQKATTALNRIQMSDAAIARAQSYLQEAARVVRNQQLVGRISITEMDAFLQELTWAHLMVDVLSHIGQGHKALTRADVLTAYGYYRNAQNKLMTANINDDRRNRMIREITEILQNKRKSISLDLMPETSLNPSKDTPDLPQEVNGA